jgi:NitT/TauT family transport system ATP-binding protein
VTSDGRVIHAVDGVSLDIPRGATVAFVGPSGCGKSTLLKLIAGLLPTTRGRVVVDGHAVNGPVKNVGMAFQNPVLLPWRTVLDNLLLPLEILRENGDARASDRAAWRDRARALLHTVRLDGAERRQPRELSGGMRQRVSLCRALIHEPALLLLDEPFAALDAFTREEMWELHQALRRDRTFTGVLVTHDLREATFLAETIYVMATSPGRIAHVHRVTLPEPRTVRELDGPAGIELIRRMRDEIRPRPRSAV